jgi:Gluconate 2-dehydrogenase subunit 3
MSSAKQSGYFDLTRRDLLSRIGGGLVALTISTPWGPLAPAEARARAAPFKNLTATEGAALEALGDVLLPGAAKAGIGHYVDDQLGRTDSLLFLKYMEYPESQLEFYRQGLASLDGVCGARHGSPFARALGEQKVTIVREISQKNPEGWNGPPAALFYFVVRNDAVDVYYGTEEGFQRLQIPYRPHLPPPAKW